MVALRLFISILALSSLPRVTGRKKEDPPQDEADKGGDTLGAKTGKGIDDAMGVSGKIAEETGAVVDDVVEWFWCLFSYDCKNTHKGVNDPVEEGEEELEVLKTWCGWNLEAPDAIDCSCCADHYVADSAKHAGLMYGGGPDDKDHIYAPAFTKDKEGKEVRRGKVLAWSLGGHVLSVWCLGHRPVCRCEDPTDLWHEEEPACRDSDACVPPDPPMEQVSQWSPRNRTANAEYDLPNCLGENKKEERVSIGSARCEDMSVQQCDRMYARGREEGTWHFCSVNQHAVRTCAANIKPKTLAKEEVKDAMAWALTNAYTPDTKWRIHEADEHFVRVDLAPVPPQRDVRRRLEEVKPEKLSESYM